MKPAHTQPHTHTQSEDPVLTRCLQAKGPLQPARSCPALVSGTSPRQQRQRWQQWQQWGLKSWPSSGSSSSSPKSSPSARRQRGEGGGREERRRGRGTAGGREGGGKNAEVLKGTLTSFLGFPWQQNIPQMNISVREREEMEGGNRGRWRQRWRKIEAGRWGGIGAGRWRQKDDGARETEGKGLKTQEEGCGLPTLPRRIQGGAEGPQDFQSFPGPQAGGASNRWADFLRAEGPSLLPHPHPMSFRPCCAPEPRGSPQVIVPAPQLSHSHGHTSHPHTDLMSSAHTQTPPAHAQPHHPSVGHPNTNMAHSPLQLGPIPSAAGNKHPTTSTHLLFRTLEGPPHPLPRVSTAWAPIPILCAHTPQEQSTYLPDLHPHRHTHSQTGSRAWPSLPATCAHAHTRPLHLEAPLPGWPAPPTSPDGTPAPTPAGRGSHLGPLGIATHKHM